VIVDRNIAHIRAWSGHAALGAVARGGAPAIVAASSASAVMLWLSSGSGAFGWLAWVALVPVAVVVLSERAAWLQRLAVPLTFALYLELLVVPALPFGVAEGHWGGPPLPVLVGDSPVVIAAAVAVPALTALLWALRFGQPWWRSGPAGAVMLGAVFGPAIAWTALEFVRVKLDPAGLWGPLFLSQRSSAAGDLVALAGPWGVTFAVVATNYAIALAIVGPRAARVAAPIVIVLLGGAMVLRAGDAGDDRSLTLAAVQPGYDTTEEDRPELRFFRPGTRARAALETIHDLGRLTRAAADRGAALVVWPEAAIWSDPRPAGPVREALEELAHETATTVVVPYFLPGRGQGATVVVEPRTGVGRSQPKQRPMWFIGEDGGNKVAPRPAPAAGTRVGTLLGVDNQDPGLAATLARRGASVLASSTHDWAQLADTQRALAQFHARATGLPVVRADWRFGSAIYDAAGRPLADAGRSLRRATVVATARPARRPTTAARLGDAPGWTAVAGAVLALALGAARRHVRRSPRSPTPPERELGHRLAGAA
jgi:apolipoprotein N-acyltransferase